jgi:hypothetical protein
MVPKAGQEVTSEDAQRERALEREIGMANRHKSHLGNRANPMEILDSGDQSLGQRRPQHCPQAEECFSLGVPMSIADVAALLGCSPWTVRQKYLPKGLPHLRASHAGKLIFFRNQIVDWVLEHQKEGTPLNADLKGRL